jgi:hypothetical protein
MKRLWFCYLTIGLTIFSAEGQEPAAPPKLPGRPETTITLDFGAEGKKTMTFPASAYVTREGWITVLAGEQHTVEFDVVKGQPANLRYVADPTTKRKPGSSRITVSLSQDSEITMLMRQTDAPKPIAMRCLTQSFGENQFRVTRLNPVDKLPYGDSWANTVCSVMLGELRFADDERHGKKTKGND